MQYFFIPTLAIAAATLVSATPMPQGGPFAAQNIPLAIKANQEFATLSASSSCNPATQPNACINGAFAQCVGSAFAVGSKCSTGTDCFSLPLVNKAGTSTTCAAPADAATRMGFASVPELDAAIGKGSSNSSSGTPVSKAPAAKPSATAAVTTTPAAAAAPNATAAAATTSAAAAATPTPAAGSIASQNIPLAIEENKQFKTLSANSPCNAATQPNACVSGNFAQCVNGAFVSGAGCGQGLGCFALPLVNKKGTSVTCTTPEDAARRMQISVGQL